jgi:hypothetical protein
MPKNEMKTSENLLQICPEGGGSFHIPVRTTYLKEPQDLL